MHPRSRTLLAFLVPLLACAAAGLVLTDEIADPVRLRRGEEFQRLVGGLGMGPAVDLSRCGFSFDPRVCPDCPLDHGPIPGGAAFCPRHACSVLYWRRPWPPGAAGGER